MGFLFQYELFPGDVFLALGHFMPLLTGKVVTGGRTMSEEFSLSVIMPVHARVSLCDFKIALASVLNQTFPAHEVIVVADGAISTELREYLVGFSAGGSVKLVQSEINRGPGAARNLGAAVAKGSYFVFMDADDRSAPNRFELQIREMKDLRLDAVGAQIAEYEDSFSRYLGHRIVPTDPTVLSWRLKIRSPMNNVTGVVSRQAFEAVGGFPVIFKGEDFVFWARIIKCGFAVTNLPDTLVDVSAGAMMTSRRLSLKTWKADSTFALFLLKEGYLSRFEFLVLYLLQFIRAFTPRGIFRNLFYRFFRNTNYRNH